MSNLVELKREYDRARRAELEKDEAKAIINTHLELNGGDDVARTATDPEQRDEELKKIAKDVINEVNASRDGGLTAEDLNPVREEFSTQVADLREHFDTKFKELATGQEDAPQALQGVLTKKIDTLVKRFEETTRKRSDLVETNAYEKIKALRVVEDANAATLSHIKSWFYNDLAVLDNMENLDQRQHGKAAQDLVWTREGAQRVGEQCSVSECERRARNGHSYSDQCQWPIHRQEEVQEVIHDEHCGHYNDEGG